MGKTHTPLPVGRHLVSTEDKRGEHFRIYVTVEPDGSRTLSLESMMVVLLSDIRDELHTLNTLLGCRRFTGIPTQLGEIAANTKKRTYTRKVGRV